MAIKILTVVGARPQFVKAAVVSCAFTADPHLEEVLVHTGQHYDPQMSDLFFDQLQIPTPRYHLDVGSLSHAAQTGRILERLEPVLASEKPDWVLVYGDTNSTLAGALAAAKLHIKIAHVEAGLRSFNRRMPEEINRVLTDHLSQALFAPTETAVNHLAKEGICGSVHLVGDVMWDLQTALQPKVENLAAEVLKQLEVDERGFILATIHRAENTDDKTILTNLLTALSQVADNLPVLFPIHPRTRRAIEEAGLTSLLSKLRVSEPLGYWEIQCLEKTAAVIATDSGGMQKEAFFYQTPCVTLRTETEWTELVESGWNRLAELTDAKAIASEILQSVDKRGVARELYGDGKASKKICRVLKDWQHAR